jgi:hypothetical protein
MYTRVRSYEPLTPTESQRLREAWRSHLRDVGRRLETLRTILSNFERRHARVPDALRLAEDLRSEIEIAFTDLEQVTGDFADELERLIQEER